MRSPRHRPRCYAAVSRLKLREFIHEDIDDPRQQGALIAGSPAVLAVGPVPRVLSPGLPKLLEMLAREPEARTSWHRSRPDAEAP